MRLNDKSESNADTLSCSDQSNLFLVRDNDDGMLT